MILALSLGGKGGRSIASIATARPREVTEADGLAEERTTATKVRQFKFVDGINPRLRRDCWT
jgi:hypothetical protein